MVFHIDTAADKLRTHLSQKDHAFMEQPDIRKYLPYLAAINAPEEAKADIVRTLFNMLQAVADEGFEAGPQTPEKD